MAKIENNNTFEHFESEIKKQKEEIQALIKSSDKGKSRVKDLEG